MKNAEYFYPNYSESNTNAYNLCLKLIKSKKFPKVSGASKDLDQFLKLFVYSGKIKDYKRYRDMVLEEFRKGELNLKQLVEMGESLKIPKGVDKSWAVFTQDERICIALDEFYEAKINFEGTTKQLFEFLTRYMLTQLLQDWRGPKLAVALYSLKKKKVKLKDLNKLLATWDFTKIF